MNYGFWDNENITLNKANKNLCNFIYEKGRLNNHDEFTILDVGCGYGVQDILWSKKISNTSNLIAVDISKKQIKYANKKLRGHTKLQKKIQKKLTYMECDAHNLLDKFTNNKFNRIISLESAFHYNNRKQFFQNVSDLLTNDGIFVISDIVLKSNTNTHKTNLYNNNLFKNIFIKIASDFLCIPEKNLITFDKWKNEIENSDLCIIETYKITDKTFNSYYNYFFKNYIKNKKLPTILYSILYHIFNTIQPFDYIVSVCKKKT
jgi:cyclopropane fatty-acyl-phospholipid synthase-like methyltransferase